MIFDMKFHFVNILSAIVFCACSSVNEGLNTEDLVYIQLNDIPQIDNGEINVNTRAITENPEGNVCAFYYQNGDGLGLFPSSGYQIPFFATGIDGDKATNVTVVAQGWLTDPELTYATYYPYDKNNFNGSEIPFSYAGQKQVGNKSAAHIKDYMLRVSNESAANGNKFSFDIVHVGTTIKFELVLSDVQSPVTFTRFAIMGPDRESFVKKGVFNMFSSPQEFVQSSLVQSRVATLDLENLTVEGSETLALFMAFAAPLTMKAGTYTLVLWDDYGNTYTGTKVFSSQIVLPKNTSNRLSVTMSLNNAIKTVIEQYAEEDAASGQLNTGN